MNFLMREFFFYHHDEVNIAVKIKITHRKRTLEVGTNEVVAQDRLHTVYEIPQNTIELWIWCWKWFSHIFPPTRGRDKSRPYIDPSGFRFWPGSEGILHAVEHGLQGGEMAQQDGGHVVLHYPIEAGLRVDFGIVIGREEAITIQAARGHEDEDAEGGIAETKPLWQTPALVLSVHADQQVNLVDIIVVHAA